MSASPTAAQSAASRRNAQASTGPVTEAGKAAASRNAVRHGLRGAVIEVSPEERNFLVETAASLERRWTPADAAERNLVQALAVMELKLVRLDTIEMQVLGAAIEQPDGRRLPSLATLTRYRNRILKERWEAEHRLRTAQAQRCTNEAEGKALAAARDDLARAETSHVILEALDQTRAGLPLNREQRRRLAAIRRRTAHG